MDDVSYPILSTFSEEDQKLIEAYLEDYNELANPSKACACAFATSLHLAIPELVMCDDISDSDIESITQALWFVALALNGESQNQSQFLHAWPHFKIIVNYLLRVEKAEQLE